MVEPKLIQLASSGTLYANEALIKFIKKTLGSGSAELKEGDNLYFFKSVGFKRGLLDVSDISYKRCIKIEKANAIIVNPKLHLPISPLGLKDNKILTTFDPNDMDDIVYQVSSFGGDYVDEIGQWLDLSKLSNQPKVIYEEELNTFVNSGMIINYDNIGIMLDMLKTDRNLAFQILNTCKLEESLVYVTYISYFAGRFNYRAHDVQNNKNLITFFAKHSCGNGVPSNIFKRLLSEPFIERHLTADIAKQISEKLDIGNGYMDYIKDINIDFQWK